ncbi:unnamed protein product [Penicillium salamii]|nr:unnamed protein product [Penicillium salamii]CAG8236367.1 unnamed protein product [Penicillium salamii]CAG8890915.1 unnamed protein product [Penicillium salamii]
MPLSRLPLVSYDISRSTVAFLGIWLTTRNTQPTFASRKPTSNNDTGSQISQVLPEDSSRLYEIPVSKQSSSQTLHRPLYCDLLRSKPNSLVNNPAVASAIELDHSGRVTGIDLSTGTTRGQQINTGFDDRILPKADSKSDATSLLQEVVSKIALLPVDLDRVPQGLTSSDKSHPEYSSESYVAPLDYPMSQEHTKDAMGTETGNGNLPQKEVKSNFGTGRAVIAGHISETTRHSSSEVTTYDFPTLSQTLAETTSSQSSSQMTGPISATKTSNREWQDTARSGSNISVGLSKKGVALLLSIVLGGSLVLIAIFTIHRFILRRLHKHTGGSATFRSQPAMSFPHKKERILPRTAEFSHFSIDT